MMIEKDKINTGRQIEVDLSRGFTALLIIICHVGLYLGDPSDEALFVFSDIVGSEFGAPVFMSLMGLCIIYSGNQSLKKLIYRGLNFLLIGYLLSFFRSLLPLIIFGNIDSWCSIGAFFVVDIMQFAGLSFILICVLKKFKVPTWAIYIISILMVGVAQYVLSMDKPLVQSEWASYFVDLFFPITEWSCFPFFIWFFFPAFGMFFGEILIRCKNKDKLYGILLPISLCGVLYVYYQFYILYPNYTSYYYGNNFYYMGIKNVLINALFILFSLSFWHYVNKILPDTIRKFLVYLSSKLTPFYIFTWIFISIMIHLSAIYNLVFNVIIVVFLMLVLLVLCMLCTKGYANLISKIKKKSKQ